MKQDNSKEIFPIVDESGATIGKATRGECHSGSKLLHPVVHLHLFDSAGRIYLQQRPLWKDIQPGKWDTAVGGHVSYGETLLEAVFREASEELGLTAFNPVFLTSYVFESAVERELVNVFAAVGSFDLRPDLDEVDEGRWWPVEEVNENSGKGIFTPNFESEFKAIEKNLLALL